MRVTPARRALALLAPITLSIAFAAPAAQGVRTPAPDDSELLTVEDALLDATYACLVATGSIAPGTPASAAVGGVTASGEPVAPTDVPADTSGCAGQVAARVARILVTNGNDAVEGATQASQFADDAAAGNVAFATPGAGTSGPAMTWATSEAVAAARPNASEWISGMNRKQDVLMDFFITGYGDPGYYNWASDECSAPLAGNGPYGFNWPCRRHDFGYRNLHRGDDRYPNWKFWTKHNKAVTDWQFRSDLFDHCDGTSSPSACDSVAATYYFAVAKNGMDTFGLSYSTLQLVSR